MSPTPARRPKTPDGAGAPERARRLLEGLLERVRKAQTYRIREEGGAAEVLVGERAFVRLSTRGADVLADLDPRAGGGDPPALRRLGGPHPDRARSAQGWRRFTIRHHGDAGRLARALRVAAVGEGGPHRQVSAAGLLVEGVRVRRLEDPPKAEDGQRVLVDAAWPRGVAREPLRVDHFWPEVAPSAVMRRAYGESPLFQRGFRRAYLKELRAGPKADGMDRLRHLAREGTLTLLVSTRELDRSHAVLLAYAVSRPKTPSF